jgi:hypothetical protein
VAVTELKMPTSSKQFKGVGAVEIRERKDSKTVVQRDTEKSGFRG